MLNSEKIVPFLVNYGDISCK